MEYNKNESASERVLRKIQEAQAERNKQRLAEVQVYLRDYAKLSNANSSGGPSIKAVIAESIASIKAGDDAPTREIAGRMLATYKTNQLFSNATNEKIAQLRAKAERYLTAVNRHVGELESLRARIANLTGEQIGDNTPLQVAKNLWAEAARLGYMRGWADSYADSLANAEQEVIERLRKDEEAAERDRAAYLREQAVN